MNIVMIGTGYVGLTSGLGFASIGNRVACVDTDSTKISKLDLGQAPFYEPGLEEQLKALQESGQIVFATDLESVIDGAQVLMIAVQTPPQANGQADLTYLYSAAEQIGRLLNHEALIVVKSTVPVGTNRHVLKIIRDELTKRGKDDLVSLIRIASVPEFLREGSALQDFLAPDRVVIGADDEITFRTIEQMHEGIKSTFLRTSIESAELIKVASNAFLATKISFINEIANIVEGTGADVREIARGVGLDKRIGSLFLRPGIGFGGSCFPKDVSALKSYAGINGYDFRLLNAVIEVNNRQRELFFNKIVSILGTLNGRKIGVWGLSFKPDTDDVRESAAIDIVQRLVGAGADVSVFDPKAMENAKHVLPSSIVYATTPIDAASGAEALLVLTEWQEFCGVSFETLKSFMIEPIIFDGRNALADFDLERLGFTYFGVGLCDSHKS